MTLTPGFYKYTINTDCMNPNKLLFEGQFGSNKNFPKSQHAMISGFLDSSDPLFMDLSIPEDFNLLRNLWEQLENKLVFKNMRI